MFGNAYYAGEECVAYISLNKFPMTGSTAEMNQHGWSRKIGRMDILKMFGEVEGLELISREHIEVVCFTSPWDLSEEEEMGFGLDNPRVHHTIPSH